MAIIIIDNGSNRVEQLADILRTYETKIIKFEELKGIEVSKNDLLILSGGHGGTVLWNSSLYSEEFSIVKDHKGPIIGICLGFELIAHVFGSHLHLNKRRFLSSSRKVRKMRIVAEPGSDILGDLKHAEVIESHNWSARKVISPLKSLATSKDGVEIFTHRTKPIYGFQFHPESRYDNGEGKAILINLVSKLYSKS